MNPFQIIQGGMGVGVSNWQLANAVASRGQLGVVSGTGLGPTLARRLQMGDCGGHMRRALASFPLPKVAQRIIARYYIEGGLAPTAPFAPTHRPEIQPSPEALDLLVAGNFVEIFLARQGHANPVGINYLEKIQIPHLASIFGAMLAGVAYVLIGAGIPRFIPGVLDAYAAGKPASYRLDVDQAEGQEFSTHFDPAAYWADPSRNPGTPLPALARPNFLAIVSSAVLALTLARKSNGRVDGFIIEGNTAGGHNAPPRGPLQLNVRGEPIYGPRDVPDLDKFRELNLPFYLAGGYGLPGKLAEALSLGAAGVQVGTAFAFCNESGIDPEYKRRILNLARTGQIDVFTDPAASPTGFPIKVLRLEGSFSDAAVFERRRRVCDLGYLRRHYRKADGTLDYRCPAEPVDEYVRKGGLEADTVGRKCLCNGLFTNIGFGQRRPASVGGNEPAVITVGDAADNLEQFLRPGADSYSADDVIDALLAERPLCCAASATACHTA
jgi:NAD(P)H-dependent flavin oxidoreductase YrpB (nitropropane dioxygenase family)